MPAKQVKIEEVKFTITAEDEELSPRASHASAGIGAADSADANRFVRDVEEMIEAHGLWGWCEVTVTAAYGPFRGHAYMGCCSSRMRTTSKRAATTSK